MTVQYDPGPLRAAREAKGLTRHQLADLTGRHFKSIMNYERGHEPSLTTAVKIARVLGIGISDLLRDDGDGPRPA